VYEIWDSLYPDVNLIVLNNQNMAMSALPEGELDAGATELVASGCIIPTPSGKRNGHVTVSTITP